MKVKKLLIVIDIIILSIAIIASIIVVSVVNTNGLHQITEEDYMEDYLKFLSKITFIYSGSHLYEFFIKEKNICE